MRDPGGVQRIGFALQNRRLQEGVTRAKLAKICGTSPRYIGEIEKGEVNPGWISFSSSARRSGG
jgi:transcriptional regulator with XRE-family HTH domain